MTDRWTTACARLPVARPWHTLLVALALLLIAGARIPGVRLTAPADNLLLRGASPPATAGTSPAAALDVLTVTYRPLGDDLMAEPALARIAQLRDALAAVPGVQAVGTLLEAPLLFSPPVRFADVAGPLQHVQETGVDTDLARAELRQSPLYRNWLLAADGQQTALRVTLQPQAARELLRGPPAKRRLQRLRPADCKRSQLEP